MPPTNTNEAHQRLFWLVPDKRQMPPLAQSGKNKNNPTHIIVVLIEGCKTISATPS